MNICITCLKNKNYHTDKERIECLELLVEKLISQLEASEIIETENHKDNKWIISITEHDTQFASRYNP